MPASESWQLYHLIVVSASSCGLLQSWHLGQGILILPCSRLVFDAYGQSTIHDFFLELKLWFFCPGSNRSNWNPSGGFYLIAYDGVRTLVFKWFSLWTDKKSLWQKVCGKFQENNWPQLMKVSSDVALWWLLDTTLLTVTRMFFLQWWW